MPYTQFDGTLPDAGTQAGTAAMQSVRDNLLALRDALAIGMLPGYNMSVSGGTAEQPAIFWWKKGAEWIKVSVTWGSTGGEAGNPTVCLCEYSANSGGAYVTIGTNTIAYDAAGNVVSTTWS